ncbi:MAG: SWIM zinc finger family protein [Shewanella sp.]
MQKTWWGNAFIDSLKAFIDSGRLQRGRAYRTDNRMLKFEIIANKIEASIRGNINPYFGITKEPKYRVTLAFTTITAKQWQIIIAKLCDNPGWISKLMLNEMPANIENAFGNTYFLPKSYLDIKACCNCPDDTNPCKHIAGVYYRLANILDRDPILLFQLRGLPPKNLHKALQKTELGQVFSEHISTAEQVKIDYQDHRYNQFKITARGEPTRQAHIINQTQYWTMTDWLLPQKEAITEINASLIKKQGDYPEFWTRSNSFIDAMEDIYSTTKRKNKKALSN